MSLITSQCQPHLSNLVSYAATVLVWGLGTVGEGTDIGTVRTGQALQASRKHWEQMGCSESTKTSSNPKVGHQAPLAGRRDWHLVLGNLRSGPRNFVSYQ